VVLDPVRLAAPAELFELVRDQLRNGRQVVLTAPPSTPQLAALVASGRVRLAAGDTVGQLGALASEDALELATTLVLDRDPVTVSAVRTAYPGAAAIAVEPGDGLLDFLHHLWLLDPPAAVEGDLAIASDSSQELFVEIADELRDAGAVWSAAQFGYRRAAERRSAAPRTHQERVLAAIWADLLHMAAVGIHDDFFAIGGDSLLAMRAVSRAAEEGIALTPRQLVAHPTIAELCAEAEGSRTFTAEQGVVDGDMPVTAAQQWFLETVAPGMTRPAHFNHPYYLELHRSLSPELLAEAVRLLVTHHDALRLRFRRGQDGAWRQAPVSPAAAVPFISHDLSAVGADEREQRTEALATAEQERLDLTDGPTVRVVHFHVGAGQRDRLLIIAHHLVVDAVSRDLLLDHLQTLCGQLERGEAPLLPPKTTSYRDWARRLQDHASAPEALSELPFWLDQVGGDDTSLPPDDPTAPVTLGTLGTVTTVVSPADTAALHEAARRLRVGIRDLLVWAVARAVVQRTGGRYCAIATTGHGREDLFDDLDVARTVGWFQVLYPLRLHVSGGADDAGSVAEVAGQLARVPRNGIGYGLLRYSSSDSDVRQRLADVPQPRLAVNYMGSFGFEEVVSQTEELFSVSDAPYGPTEDVTGTWPYALDVTGSMAGGELRIEMSFGTAAYRRERVDVLLADVRARLLGALEKSAGSLQKDIGT